MTLSFKPRVAKQICRIDRKTQAVTASVNFEDIDLTIDGEGSEVYDYEYMFILHSDSNVNGSIKMKLNSLTSYSDDRMRGISSSASSVSSTGTSIPILQERQSAYTSMTEGKITGSVGNKRHVDVLLSKSNATTTEISKQSHYTSDTSTELTSLQLFNGTTGSITYSLIITAVPKLQYNPSAILLSSKTLTAQTADIIYGGVNDTEGVDDLDGDEYDYYVVSSGLSSEIVAYINEVTTGSRTRQQLVNSGGSISSNNGSPTKDATLKTTDVVHISSDTGRKKLIINSVSNTSSAQQVEEYTSNPDTSTPMTSLMLRPSASTNGTVQLYAVPKGYNADLTPWTDRQVVDIAGDFSAGASFDIPSWAMFMKVDFVGEQTVSSSELLMTFNNTTQSTDRQYLLSAGSGTSANFGATNYIGSIAKVCKTSTICSLKNGANRPYLTQNQYSESVILITGSWIKDSATAFTTAQIKASTTNTINGKLTVSFY